jgi:DNA polymerase sigma
MGKKQRKDSSKQSQQKGTSLSLKKTIKINFISRKLRSKKIKSKQKLNQNKKNKQINSTFPVPGNDINPVAFNSSKVFPKNVPKWMKQETLDIKNPYERFNSEINDYVLYIIPHGFSIIKRKYTIELLTHIIQKYNSDWKVVLYGSFSQNTSTVFSDLDLAINDNNKYYSGDMFKLFYIMNILQKEGFSKDIEYIDAKVPILRGICSSTGVSIDICFNKKSGFKASEIIRNIIDQNIIIKQAVIFFKILLIKNNLNETYTGGMCSFLLFHLVYYFYIILTRKNINEKKNIIININSLKNINEEVLGQDFINDFNINKKINDTNSNDSFISKKNTDNEEDKGFEQYKIYTSEYDNKNSLYDFNNKSNINILINNYEKNEKVYFNENMNDIKIGDFILSFLKFYGFEFDHKHLGFSVNQKNFGKTFTKINGYEEDTISAESIEEEEFDVGIKCFNYYKIVELFERTYFKIKIERDSNIFSILKSLEFPIYE